MTEVIVDTNSVAGMEAELAVLVEEGRVAVTEEKEGALVAVGR